MAADRAETVPEFADSSGPLFFMYRKMAEEEDNKMAERWQKDADGILIFVSLQFIFDTASHIESKYYRPVCSLLPSRHYLR